MFDSVDRTGIDPSDIDIHHVMALIESEGEDGGCGVFTDARK
jgi:hypothetical protein